MPNIIRLREKQAKLQAIVNRASTTPADAHLEAVSRSFHLGTVGGSGHNTASLNRRREASLDRTISNAVRYCEAKKELAWVSAQIYAFENAPARAEARSRAESRMSSHGASVVSTVRPGDYIHWIVSGTNCKVIRVNRTSVTVEMCGGEERLKFSEITATTEASPSLNL